MAIVNRFRRMSPHDLSQALNDLNLTAGQFAKLAGTQRKRILHWLEPTTDDIPHHIAVMVELLALPGAMQLALEVTLGALIEEETEEESHDTG